MEYAGLKSDKTKASDKTNSKTLNGAHFMIKQYRISLKADNNSALSAISSYYMYGMLTELLEPDYASFLHENSFSPISQYIRINPAAGSAEWTINLLGSEAINQISPVLESNSYFYITGCNCQLTVQDLSICLLPSDEALIGCARKLPDIAKPTMEFISPTSFKSYGEYLIFPSVEHIIRNLVNRWNSYSQSYVINDEDAVVALIQGIKIAGYRLQSSHFRLKGASIPGFKGEVRFSTRLSIPIAELFKILLFFSEYSGVGIKTSLGMGATKYKIN